MAGSAAPRSYRVSPLHLVGGVLIDWPQLNAASHKQGEKGEAVIHEPAPALLAPFVAQLDYARCGERVHRKIIKRFEKADYLLVIALCALGEIGPRGSVLVGFNQRAKALWLGSFFRLGLNGFVQGSQFDQEGGRAWFGQQARACRAVVAALV